MNVQHTSGPWNWIGDVLVSAEATIIEARWWNAAPGDRSLIAAAPDMLAALKGIMAHMPDHPDTAWQAVEEAIAKARAA